MRRVGQARKRDQNEAAIVEALEAIGVLVQRVSVPGFCDLVAQTSRRLPIQDTTMLLEVKSPRGKATAAQTKTNASWRVLTVHSVAEALAIFGVTVTP